MCEEYLSSEELMRKIAELKIRLALQQEFEQEVEELLGEAEPPDAGQSGQIREMEERVLKDIAEHALRRRPRSVQKRRSSRAVRVVALVALLVMVSVGSAAATVHMVQIGLLKLDIHTTPRYTSYALVPSQSTIDVPQDWAGNFYPAYIPEGFELEYCYSTMVDYFDKAGNLLSFSEDTYTAVINLDTEDAELSSVLINGAEATLIEKEGWVTVVWMANNRLFIVEIEGIDGAKDAALQVASSVVFIR